MPETQGPGVAAVLARRAPEVDLRIRQRAGRRAGDRQGRRRRDRRRRESAASAGGALLRKHGRNWDAASVPNVGLKDLDRRALDAFRRLGVAKDRVSLWNPGELPVGWAEAELPESKPEAKPRPESQPESSEPRPESRPKSLEARVLHELANGPLSKAELSRKLVHKSVSGRLNQFVRALVSDGRIAFTVPDKPRSRLQQYRLTNGRSAPDATATGRAEP